MFQFDLFLFFFFYHRDCKTASPCLDGSEDKIIYAWALNASGLELPDEVGYKVGPQANIRSLVVQVHIGKTEGESSRGGI